MTQLELTNEHGFMPPVDKLTQVRLLGQQLINLDDEIEKLQEQLNSLNHRRKDIAEHILPDLMIEAELSEFTFSDGTRVVNKATVYASMPPEGSRDREAVVSYMKERNADNLIKNVLEIEKGYDDEVLVVYDQLRDAGVPVKKKEAVHPQSFLKFVREQLEQDPEFPKDTFKVVEGWRVEFKNN